MDCYDKKNEWSTIAQSMDRNISQEDARGWDEAQRKLEEIIEFLKAVEDKTEGDAKPSELSRSTTELRKKMQQGAALFEDPLHAPIQVNDIIYENLDKAKVIITDGSTIGLVTPNSIGEAYHDFDKKDIIDLGKKVQI
ncbi:hypothetical protein PTNB73_00420 [Pyrenophora teres f. teres]|nr:hypothetical protein HRS9139_01662 [Pyrenophora teres f. teres]KAE8851403.1 hypothetical protein HRS9122_01690 [Pyrenophora teres f. teres]KAE8873788.1 hypothetical protein PTNB73_00420 [Pyrenophora teres f. teres]